MQIFPVGAESFHMDRQTGGWGLGRWTYINDDSNSTSQQDFGTRKVYCVSNVTFHAESKYAIKIFPSPTVFVQWPFKLLIFRNFWYFHQ